MRSLAVMLALLVTACGGGSHQLAQSAGAPVISHVVVIAMENHSRSQVIGTAPYITSLAQTYGEATAYQNLTHPSLPNYLAVTGGSPAGTDGSDCGPSASCGSDAPSIYSEVGTSWKSYNESMPTHCDGADSGSYAPRHNPAVYYRALTGCSTRDISLATSPSTAARFTFITPNLTHDMHDGSVAQGDAWLHGYLPKLMATTQYKAGTVAIFVWWDENSGSGTLPFVIVSPYTHGVNYPGVIDHYDTLYTIQRLLGVACLAQTCGQTDFSAAFGL